MSGRSTQLLTFCSTSGGAGSDALMPPTMRSTGLGANSGIQMTADVYGHLPSESEHDELATAERLHVA